MVAELREVYMLDDDTDQGPTAGERGADGAPLSFEAFDSGQALADAVFPEFAVRPEDTELGGSPWPWHLQAQAIKDALPEGRKNQEREAPLRFADWDEPHHLAESMVDYLCPAQPLQRRLLGVLRGHDEQLASYMADYWRALSLWLEDMPDQPHGAVKTRRMPERYQAPIAAKYGWGIRYGQMKRKAAAVLIEPALVLLLQQETGLSTKVPQEGARDLTEFGNSDTLDISEVSDGH